MLEQVLRDSQPVVRAGADVADWRDLTSDCGFGGFHSARIAPDRLLGLIAANHRRGDAAECDSNIRDVSIVHPRCSRETDLGDRLRLARPDLAVILPPA